MKKKKTIQLTPMQNDLLESFWNELRVIDGMINGMANQRHLKNTQMWDIIYSHYPELKDREAKIMKGGLIEVGEIKSSKNH